MQTATPINSEDDALTVTIQHHKKHLATASPPWGSRDEPDWQSGTVLFKSLQLVGASNATKVGNALSVPTDVLRHLPTVRNFYAHRVLYSAAKVRRLAPNYALRTDLRPEDFCSSFAPRRPQSVLVDWLSELQVLIDFAVL